MDADVLRQTSHLLALWISNISVGPAAGHHNPSPYPYIIIRIGRHYILEKISPRCHKKYYILIGYFRVMSF